jgi:opacity protein-like surface antigen
MMRRVLLASSALALLSGAAYAADTVVYVPPAPPAPPPVMGPVPMGYVDAAYGNISSPFLGGGSLDEVAIGGAANIPFGAWNFQLEVRDHQWLPVLNTLAVNLHVYTRNQSFAAGGFVGYETFLGVLDNYTVGLEAAGFFGPFTIMAQGTYANINVFGGGNVADLWTIRGVARYFINPNFKLEAGIRYSQISAGGGNADFLTAEGEIEYKFGAASIFGNAQYLFGGDLGGTDLLALRGGVRIHLGTASLLDQDRNGAGTFDTETWLLP